MAENKPIIAVIGLGYVGLPVAVEFGKQYLTIGYDLKAHMVEAYKRNIDPTGELTADELKAADKIEFTIDPERISIADYIIIAVPTPIDNARQPDLSPLKSASRIVGRFMKKGVVVVYESTVYPGTTEEVCVPVLEKESGLIWKQDFHVGYSPERINPGDKKHTLTSIVKIVSADNPETLNALADLYGSIISAGIYRAPNIKTAEAAKVIENTQRDLNIALMNELAVIFDKYKAETTGYHPKVILAGRRINDNMGKFIAEKTVKLMTRSCRDIKNARVGILGLTFKEDCADLRNSRVIDIVRELESYGLIPMVHDPLADEKEAKAFFGINLTDWDALTGLDAMIFAVGHNVYKKEPIKKYLNKLKSNGCIIDVKAILEPSELEKNGVQYWRL